MIRISRRRTVISAAVIAGLLVGTAPASPAFAEQWGGPTLITCPVGQVAQMKIVVTKAGALRGWGKNVNEALTGNGNGGYEYYPKKGTFYINKGWRTMYVQVWGSQGESKGTSQCVLYS